MDCSICTHFLGNFILADDFSNCLVKNHACIWRKPHEHVISKNAFLISAPLVMGEQWGPIQNKHLSFFFLFFSLVSHIESISNFFWLSFDYLLTTFLPTILFQAIIKSCLESNALGSFYLYQLSLLLVSTPNSVHMQINPFILD